MDRITANIMLGVAIIVAALALAEPAYEMVGATARGVVVFNKRTGDTEVRQPIPFPTTTTLPAPEDSRVEIPV